MNKQGAVDSDALNMVDAKGWSGREGFALIDEPSGGDVGRRSGLGSCLLLTRGDGGKAALECTSSLPVERSCFSDVETNR